MPASYLRHVKTASISLTESLFIGRSIGQSRCFAHVDGFLCFLNGEAEVAVLQHVFRSLYAEMHPQICHLHLKAPIKQQFSSLYIPPYIYR